MKALLINGSPHKMGCTYTALGGVETGLQEQGVQADIMWLGTGAISGCLGCGKCLKDGHCFIDDVVNQVIDDVKNYDAFVFGTPVHFAAASGAMTSFMDRLFYGRGALFAGKPAAAVVSCRRGGASAAFDQMNKYFTISSMMVVGGRAKRVGDGNGGVVARRHEQGVERRFQIHRVALEEPGGRLPHRGRLVVHRNLRVERRVLQRHDGGHDLGKRGDLAGLVGGALEIRLAVGPHHDGARR